ncbi:uncharacterized protein LOC116702014 [Etheostoma spectabile]|uniref:uncharacterized protein LOC116702014 n=1 Tax=Etheostoma spectabile TaxID=54343 RepID=UPI0013AF6D96|nr:uncharacterized protein LOC116702014 [Etheostoma spectabile]
MAGVLVEMLSVVLTVTLLLVPIQGWKHIDWTQLSNSDEPEQWRKPQLVTLTDDRLVLDSEEDEVPEYVLPEVKGASTSENVNPFADHGFQVDAVDAHLRSWTSRPSSSVLEVVCSEVGFQITLLAGSLSEVTVLGSKKLLPVMDAPKSCGYEVDSFNNTLTVPFTGCHVKHTDHYSLELLYVDEIGQTQVATASCEENLKIGPRLSGKFNSKCFKPVATPPPSNPSIHSKLQLQGMMDHYKMSVSGCDVPLEEQLACGFKGIVSSSCEMRGCCMSSSGCYYPLDACTGGNFVFAIRFNSASIPLDPTKLIIPGSPNCKPVLVNDKVAIFKFKVTECGARSYEVGETTIYLAEVQSVVQTLNLKYGIITRSNPLKFMVECRYNKVGASQQELASVGYMVKTPSSSLPLSIISHGLYGVTLRIAHDETYSSYFPTYHQPLRLLLGKPVYLELLLKSPKPDAVILVNYCLAYPRSAKNALVLIYEGCANPYDPTVSVLKVIGLPKNRHQRRFLVQAFEFMDQKTNKYLDEEIYFMCSTEVCRTDEKTCEEQCFDGKIYTGGSFGEGMAHQVPSRPHGQAHAGPSGQAHQDTSEPDGQAHDGPSGQAHQDTSELDGQAHQDTSEPDGQAHDGPSGQAHQHTSEPDGQAHQDTSEPDGQAHDGPSGQAHQQTSEPDGQAHQETSRPDGLAHDGPSGQAHQVTSGPDGQVDDGPSRPDGQAHDGPFGQVHQGSSGPLRQEPLGVTGQSACWGRRQNGPSGPPRQANQGPSGLAVENGLKGKGVPLVFMYLK